LVKNRIVIPKD